MPCFPPFRAPPDPVRDRSPQGPNRHRTAGCRTPGGGRSLAREFGPLIGSPRMDCERLRAAANATAATPIAPPITKASEGSQAPGRSRKPSTLAGSAMPDTRRPSPNTKPASREKMVDMALATHQKVTGNDRAQSIHQTPARNLLTLPLCQGLECVSHSLSNRLSTSDEAFFFSLGFRFGADPVGVGVRHARNENDGIGICRARDGCERRRCALAPCPCTWFCRPFLRGDAFSRRRWR
jgi:hypothetical protein